MKINGKPIEFNSIVGSVPAGSVFWTEETGYCIVDTERHSINLIDGRNFPTQSDTPCITYPDAFITL